MSSSKRLNTSDATRRGPKEALENPARSAGQGGRRGKAKQRQGDRPPRGRDKDEDEDDNEDMDDVETSEQEF